MNVSTNRDKLRAQLKRDEGTGPFRHGRHYPYVDTVGKVTIGYGRNLTDNGITMAQADSWLDEDIDGAIKDCVVAFPWFETLNPARQGVLVNMSFNLGIVKLLQFKQTLKLIQRGDYEDAAVAMLQSKWASQVGDRALRLAEQMRRGEWV